MRTLEPGHFTGQPAGLKVDDLHAVRARDVEHVRGAIDDQVVPVALAADGQLTLYLELLG